MDDISFLHDLSDMSLLINSKKKRTREDKVEDLLNLPEDEFKKRFRMGKGQFLKLQQLIGENKTGEEGNSQKLKRKKPVSSTLKLMAALRYLGTGSHQILIADWLDMPHSTVNQKIQEMITIISSMGHSIIKFPTGEELGMIKEGFHKLIEKRSAQIKPFPSVIGCIDGCQIEVLAPGIKNRETLRNRKDAISINVQAVCDHRLLFTNLVNRWAGSVHDSRIFSNSDLMGLLESGSVTGYLLGDSGYPLKPYLMTPISDPQKPEQFSYNISHVQTRNCIERAFGVLKKRFAILSQPIRLDLKNALNAITACFVLHNFIITTGDDTHEFIEESSITRNDDNPVNRQDNDRSGEIIRSFLLQTHFK